MGYTAGHIGIPLIHQQQSDGLLSRDQPAGGSERRPDQHPVSAAAFSRPLSGPLLNAHKYAATGSFRPSSVRSGMFIEMQHLEQQAPSGAACAGSVVESAHMPLLTELKRALRVRVAIKKTWRS